MLLCLSGCASFKRGISKFASFATGESKKEQITQAELQDDLLRFESQFNARIQNASLSLEGSENSDIRYRAAINRLIYSSNSLNIALGPSPESNLLDMVTFIELSHDVLKRHWIPMKFRESGQALDDAFFESKQQIWGIAEKVMTAGQKAQLENVISTWRSRHPEQINVETVRLSAFSTEAGAKAAGLDHSVGGLFASVQQSTEAVDSAKLFAERALYFAERLPFLLRLQARLGVQEIIQDTKFSFFNPSSNPQAQRGASLLKEIQHTVLLTKAMVGEINMAAKNLSTLAKQFASQTDAGTTQAPLKQLTSLLKELNQLLSSEGFQRNSSQMAAISKQLRREGDRIFAKLAWLIVGFIAFFWTMYFVAKLAYEYFHHRLVGRLESTSQNEQKRAA